MENCGQSLAVSVTELSGNKVSQMWYEEQEHYNYNSPGWNQYCTNFTQMTWRSTQRVGVGRAKRPGGGMQYIVAHYYPAGNIGSFRNNVKPPISSGQALTPGRTAGGRIPPPPPPPDVPPPPPPDAAGHDDGSNYLRKAVLENYGPFLFKPKKQDGSSADSHKSSFQDSARAARFLPVADDSALPASKQAAADQSMTPYAGSGSSDMRVKPSSSASLVGRNGVSAEYWDAALHMVRFKRPEGMAQPSQPSGAHTSLAKIRATRSFEKDPAMEGLQEIMEREFMGQIDVSPAMLQQLRGVFSAADDNNDGYLTLPQLEQALLSFGVRPTDDLVEHFVMLSRNSGKIDLATFMYVFSKTRGNAAVKDCSSEVLGLFRFLETPFKKDSEERKEPVRVTRNDLRHVLTEVEVPNKLSSEEAKDFLTYADAIMAKAAKSNSNSSAYQKGAGEFDFEELVKQLVKFEDM